MNILIETAYVGAVVLIFGMILAHQAYRETRLSPLITPTPATRSTGRAALVLVPPARPRQGPPAS